MKPKVGDRVRCIKEGHWMPPLGTEGTIARIDMTFKVGTPDKKASFGELAVAWDHDRKGTFSNYPWQNYMELIEKPKKPAPKAVPKAKPEMPKVPPYLPGDRVRVTSKVMMLLDKGTCGTVIGMFKDGHAVMVDWAPWNHGHNEDEYFDRELGYPKGTRLPARTGWNIDTDSIELIRRGNIVYKEENP